MFKIALLPVAMMLSLCSLNAVAQNRQLSGLAHGMETGN
jgi:hypothetical protein